MEGLFELLFDAADLGGDVGLADTEDRGDFTVGVVVEIQEHERAVEVVELVDEVVELVDVGCGLCRFALVRESFDNALVGMAELFLPALFAAQKGDGDVECDAVDPRRQFVFGVVAVRGLPQLDDDFLFEISAVLRIAAIGVADLVDDLAVYLLLLLYPDLVSMMSMS